MENKPFNDARYVRKKIWWDVSCGIFASAFFGAILFGGCTAFWWKFGFRAAFCDALWNNPPWALFSGIAAAPALIRLWEWRTTQRNREVATAEAQERHRAQEFTLAQDQQRHRDREYALAQQQQVSARFVEAVRLLSEQSGDARFGGIYALERIAMEAAETYKSTVVKTLSAFVRTQAPLPPDNVQWDEYPGSVEDDVAVALEVLCVLGPSGDTAPELSDCLLFGAKMGNAILDGTRFPWCDLRFAEFTRASLRGAIFQHACLNDAQLVETNFDGANLYRASLRNVHAWKASFICANLEEADLRGAVLSHVDLRGAKLHGAKLSEANLNGAIYSTETEFPLEYTPPDMMILAPMSADSAKTRDV